MLSTKLKEAAGNSADATLYVDDVFSTYLYTGNGTIRTITNGIDLAGKGGMVWIKNRSDVYQHKLTTTITPAYALNSNTTSALAAEPNGLTAFTSSGFTIGLDGAFNLNANNFASWTFRKAAKFFDVVTYTGTGSARTIAHSLGVAPGMVIVKRTDTTSNWQVYSNGLTSAAYSIQLNLTAAQASAPTVWNSTSPTSSVFSVGTDATVNASGGTYVAYLYAHDTSSTGIIQCGSYTTNGSGQATINLGYEPQWVMIKGTSTTSSWVMFDTMRGFTATSSSGANSQGLLANSSGAESGPYDVQLTATGFIDNASIVGTAQTFIYMAIRRPNKPPTLGTQVFGPVTQTTATDATVTTNFVVDWMINSDRLAGQRVVWDRLRGGYVNLLVTTGAENNYSPNLKINFASNTSIIDSYNNLNTGVSEIYYNFRRASGFFDVVCYTGTGSATTQAHNLTVVPELMIVKERSAVNNWWVYVSSIGNTKYSVLNSTATPATSATAWNNTTPTASVFSIGTGANVNASAQTFVAYLFATLAGISKVGSYTGNGTGQVIACGFSAGARFVLIKRTDAVGGWYTFDSARGLTAGSSPYLLLNSTAAETTGNNGVYASTGGFTLGATAITTTNIASATYIFLSVT